MDVGVVGDAAFEGFGKDGVVFLALVVFPFDEAGFVLELFQDGGRVDAVLPLAFAEEDLVSGFADGFLLAEGY